MKLYDSLKREFVEIDVPKFCIYSCGPTVYDFIHIGNARPLILTDIIVRYLEYMEIKYKYLLNITDIDDKIIQRAAENNITEEDHAKIYSDAFLNDLKNLNIKSPTLITPISSKISEILIFIDDLLKKGFAYEKKGNVYFDISQWNNQYGSLSNQNINNLNNGERIEVDENKKNPQDFILWKKTKTGKKWLSKWGFGRPGWHTECALLIDDFFKDTIDIHVGGIDLKFPHHENERIQYIAKNSKELSNIWLHNGHISIEDVKMSKSLKNTILVKDFLEENGANSLRYIFLNSNYRQPLNISQDLINQSLDWVSKIESLLKTINWSTAIGQLILINETPIDEDFNSYKYITNFKSLLNDDLNTPMIISLIDEMCKSINIQMKNKKVDLTYKKLLSILKVLGFNFNIKKLDKLDIEKIKEWKILVSQKKFDKADKLRETLKQENII
ncbi:cysteine--tRNA ligase [Spiroplasma cantharicola]|uniref:Cysteine--tRNA ligase n=1 Tax=Spiroplasma cantharicola TaxID=362837 RepID=A0A0M4KBI7_9MOLU|nr:cysteine--tRNA ligase [Spiroplasma cantharicola]ALD65940.1 cysteinyl-tRNA synthetase [Spiroplasma cantharicola]